MKIFELLYDYEHDNNALILKIDQTSLGFDRYDAEVGKPFTKWNENIKTVFKKKPNEILKDNIASNLTWFIVSKKFKDLLEAFDLGEVQFLPLHAVSEDGKEKIDDIWLFNICNLSDSLNLENSLVLGEIAGKPNIVKYALTESKIGNYDIFRLKDATFPIFISERLMKAMKKNKITGCDYLQVKVV